ncbi:MAG: hypothetical protein HYT12_04050 [Candidatus Liptonbacteria bacterium]|nr:hypothetical protein [Candidatus Liptonbacteria bacterium]
MLLTDYLTVAQTVFFSIISLVIIAIGAILIVAAYYLMRIAGHVNRISENLDNASEEVKKDIFEIFEKLSALPFIKKLIRKRVKNKHNK